jgi:pimeloyl-ACP methyl ester carboxylesterase
MITIILPGFSLHNKDWAYEIKAKVKTEGKIMVHEWRHWKIGGGISVSYEVGKILEEAGKEKINIIAKSVGTRITLALLKEIPSQIEKIILCGIPTTSPIMLAKAKEVLKDFDAGKIICFQNTSDPFSSYAEVKEFMKGVNPKIKVIEKPRSDHSYPYFSDFEIFLK